MTRFVLMVDDNDADIELMRDACAEAIAGIALVGAEGGQEAIELLDGLVRDAKALPAAILLDLNMPRVHGREVLAYLKGSAALAGTPVIVFSSSSSPKDRAACLALGARDFWTKPNTLDELEAAARRLAAMLG